MFLCYGLLKGLGRGLRIKPFLHPALVSCELCGDWGVGSGEWVVGSGEWGVGSGQWGVGSGEWAVEW